MNVTLTCWSCSTAFIRQVGPGAIPKYCGVGCRLAARRARQRMDYEQRAEARRIAHSTQ